MTQANLRTLITPARVYALTRIALGTWLAVAPSGFGAKWFAFPQDPLLTASIIRSVGARDVAIGTGLLLARSPRPWLLICAFCDAFDATMVLVASPRFSGRDTVTGVAGALSYGLIAIAIAIFSRRRPS